MKSTCTKFSKILYSRTGIFIAMHESDRSPIGQHKLQLVEGTVLLLAGWRRRRRRYWVRGVVCCCLVSLCFFMSLPLSVHLYLSASGSLALWLFESLHFFSCVARVVVCTLGVLLSFQPHVMPRLCASGPSGTSKEELPTCPRANLSRGCVRTTFLRS